MFWETSDPDIYLDVIWHEAPPKHPCKWSHSHSNVTGNGLQYNAPYHTDREKNESTNMTQCWLGFQNPEILIRSSTCRLCQNKTGQWRFCLITHKTQKSDSNILVANTTWHLRGNIFIPWWELQEVNLYNIQQVGLSAYNIFTDQ